MSDIPIMIIIPYKISRMKDIKSVCLSALMEIKGNSQCIAANKQQWCGLVAAASCGIVDAFEFFVCK